MWVPVFINVIDVTSSWHPCVVVLVWTLLALVASRL
jgi:hypothetical protein